MVTCSLTGITQITLHKTALITYSPDAKPTYSKRASYYIAITDRIKNYPIENEAISVKLGDQFEWFSWGLISSKLIGSNNYLAGSFFRYKPLKSRISSIRPYVDCNIQTSINNHKHNEINFSTGIEFLHMRRICFDISIIYSHSSSKSHLIMPCAGIQYHFKSTKYQAKRFYDDNPYLLE